MLPAAAPPLPQGEPGAADARNAEAALVAAFARHAGAQLLALEFEGKLVLTAVPEEARSDPHSVGPFPPRQRGQRLDPRAVCAAAEAAAVSPAVIATIVPLPDRAATPAATRLVLSKAAALAQ